MNARLSPNPPTASLQLIQLFLVNEWVLFWRAFQPKGSTANWRGILSNRLFWMAGVFLAGHIFAYETLKGIDFGDALKPGLPDSQFLIILASLTFYSIFVVSTNILAITNNLFQVNNNDLVLTAPLNFGIYFAKQMISGIFMNFVFSCYFLLPLVDVLMLFGGIGYIQMIPAALAVCACAYLLAMTLTLALYRRFNMRAAARVVRISVPIILLLGSLAGQTSRFYITSLGRAHGYDLFAHLHRNGWYFFPVHAFQGSLGALAAMLMLAVVAFALALRFQPDRYRQVMLIAGGQTFTRKSVGQSLSLQDFQSPRRSVWRKEFLTARRNPFLMQQFFSTLIPVVPAFMSLGVTLHSLAHVNWPGVAALLGYISCLITGLFIKMALLNEGAVDLLASSPVSEGLLIRYKLQQAGLLVACIFSGPWLALAWFSKSAALALVVADIVAFAALSVIYIAYRGNTVDMPRLKQKRLPIFGMLANFAICLVAPGLAFLLALGSWWALLPLALLLITLDLVLEPELRKRAVSKVFRLASPA
ncbi:MAG: hypothetical protein KGQ46_12185 [Hyphomicrobiales bacterium]|nr:hypothetical protein [Hyphomicrobiales bacterium]MDE2115190.1 hypothetical protein [Hyphomicrobiales bacterium]